MRARISRSELNGTVRIPGSKSHMIRALYFASLGKGKSIIRNPVSSNDSLSAAGVVKAMGIEIEQSEKNVWTINGGELIVPKDVINVGNSGTSMSLGSALLASIEGMSVVTGDEQIRRRPIQPVLDALTQMGASARTVLGNGSAPFILEGPLKGGIASVEALNSQYVSAALIAASLAERDSEIIVDNPNEIPYIEMTIQWMKRLGISIQHDDDFRRFFVKTGKKYQPFDTSIPADFSSAAFFLVGAAITDSHVVLEGLDIHDVQGDKVLIDILKDMGANIGIRDDGSSGIVIKGGSKLKGLSVDCSFTPDSVPILAVLGCYSDGETRLYNIESSRIKETDRPLIMKEELKKMGANLELKGSELIIRNSKLNGAEVCSHNDHRIAMALCIAGLVAEGQTVIDEVGCAGISYPGFDNALVSLGANVEYS